MAKLWEGRTKDSVNEFAEKLNSSIGVDYRMIYEDIDGSIAHARMLEKQGIISESEMSSMVDGLMSIRNELSKGKLIIDMTSEDVHTFVEAELTKRIGENGKRLHTARSRNDQVALDERLYLLKETEQIKALLRELLKVLTELAEKHASTIMPGYTHLQRAQPVSFGQHLMAYAFMLIRDISRLDDSRKRIAVSPIGACALAGTTYDTDRRYEASLLGLREICMNSMDAVSDRDFILELLADLSILMMHLSRFCEEILLWSSWEFRFVELSDDFTTGSSIMPQKKNSDMAELIRGKTGRVYGDLMSLLTVMKGLPLAYNKDMQEDKEPVFDAVDTVKICLSVMAPMLAGMTVNKENMLAASKNGFINATDLADYLTKKGMPFRTAYRLSGEIVSRCIREGYVLETFPLDEYKKYSSLFEEDIYKAIDLRSCAEKRLSEGGTSEKSVLAQIEYVKKYLE